jgi:hypothetical protein
VTYPAEWQPVADPAVPQCLLRRWELIVDLILLSTSLIPLGFALAGLASTL